MTLSELIARLQKIQDELGGGVPVYVGYAFGVVPITDTGNRQVIVSASQVDLLPETEVTSSNATLPRRVVIFS